MSPTLPARLWRGAAALCALFALLGCDSSSRIDNYQPTRFMSFGDELSVVASDGRKYSVNAFASGTTTLDCGIYPVWNQTLGSNFGLNLPGCSSTATNNVMAAVAGAKVAGVTAQVAAIPTSDLVPSTLVTIQGGMWDVLEAYEAFKAATVRDGAFTLVAARATALANLINSTTRNGAGARVIYGTVPDLGYSPFAFKEQTAGACGSTSCNTLLSDLSTHFNETLRINVVNDGRYAGLVVFDDLIRSMANPSFRTNVYGLVNTDEATQRAACTAGTITDDLRNCNATTLVAGAGSSGTTYLWAGDVLPGPAWHSRIAGVAVTRARNNPF